MESKTEQQKTQINVRSEYGQLNAVLLHRPGVEIEAMTPQNYAEALYNDLLNKKIVDREYDQFSGVLERWAKVYYVSDILEQLLEKNDIAQFLSTEKALPLDCIRTKSAKEQARILIEGMEDPKWQQEDGRNRYIIQPLYNLFFTRDASSSMYDRVLINSMSFAVRQRETLLFNNIFEQYFNVPTLCASRWDAEARTEGGDVQIAREDLLCIGNGIRTNRKGIDYLAQTFAKEKSTFNIIVQELPESPDSFIHLDMVFTFLGADECMVYRPMVERKGAFADKHTTLISIDNGKISYHDESDILSALKHVGMEMKPLWCGGSQDPWLAHREQWHSGANFFALGPNKVIGYGRNTHTIEELNKNGYAVLSAADICAGKVDMHQYAKFVATVEASELPRGCGGARCMTMPLNRE